MIAYVWKILFIAREYKYWMLLAAVIGFFTVGSGIGLMMTSAYIISKAALHGHIYELQVGIVGVRFFGISRGVFRYFERLISHETTFKILAKIRYWFFKSLTPLVPSKTIDLTSGDLLNRAIGDVEKLEHLFVRVISPIFVFILTTVLMWFLLGIFDFNYSIIFILIFIPAAVIIPGITFLLSRKHNKTVIELSSKINNLTVDAVQGLKELLLFGHIEKWRAEFEGIQKRLLYAERKMNSIRGLHESFIGLTMNITVLLMMTIAIPDVSNGTLSGVNLAVISIGIMAAFEALIPIPLAFQNLEESSLAAKRLLSLVENNPLENIPNYYNEQIENYNIECKNISFIYEGNRPVLNGLNLRLEGNQLAALVGASGSGKTTIVNLLTGLWECDSGEILIGGKNIRNISTDRLKDSIAVVGQAVSLFTGTIKENLLFADKNSAESEIWNVLEKAELKNFVESLPRGLNTEIGELGKKLSGGEARRLTIARALLKKSPVVIFDEPSSGLDSFTERKIFNLIKNISKEKIALVITHRLIGMEMFDNIFVLKGGKIIEKGKHAELLRENGIYKKMFDSQNQLV